MIGPILLKAFFQGAIDSGEIKSYEELLAMVNDQSLEITRNGKTKDGIRYMGLRESSGKRFRIYFDFAEPGEPGIDGTSAVGLGRKVTECRPAGRPIWIYALHARCAHWGKKACYIGQTVDLTRRLREHHLSRRPDRSSFALFEWAEGSKAEVMVALLERTEKGQAYATRCEGHWIRLARDAGYELPNVEKWGALPTWKHAQFKSLDESCARSWPETSIWELSRPISELGSGDRIITPRISRSGDPGLFHWII